MNCSACGKPLKPKMIVVKGRPPVRKYVCTKPTCRRYLKP